MIQTDFVTSADKEESSVHNINYIVPQGKLNEPFISAKLKVSRM
jgi:hypothetical protein